MIYEYWFAGIKNISDNKKKKLRATYGSAKEIYYIEETQSELRGFLSEKDIKQLKIAQRQKDLEEKYYNMKEKGIDFVPYFHKAYPKRLQKFDDAPYALYVKGKLPEESRPSVAIIGARRCSSYGEEQALEYGKCLATAGIEIISGLALGIDGAGHRGALNGKGRTYGVLGCGADVCYPRENIGLYMDIQKEGGIISELLPGEPPMPYHFPLRNRIISGLSDVVLVIEAKEKSGSLITADMALEQGRDIYALPGPVTSALSQGCHRLIRQGAGILISPEEFLKELQIDIPEKSVDLLKNEKMLETTEKVVYSCLDLFPRNVSEIQTKTGLDVRKLMETLTTLEMKGFIKETAKNYYVRLSDVS